MVDRRSEVRSSLPGLLCFSILLDGFCDFFLSYNGNVSARRRRYFDVKADVSLGNFYLILLPCADVHTRYWWSCIWFTSYSSL